MAGTLSFDLDGSFATYLGWLIPWGTPLTLLGQGPEQVAEAQRELVRIGIHGLAAAATGRPDAWTGSQPLRSYPVADFAAWLWSAAIAMSSSWTSAAIRNGAPPTSAAPLIFPCTSCPRLAEVPAGEVWVHCEAGYRASVAASFLDAAGRTVVAVDDEYHRAAAAGLPVAGRPARGLLCPARPEVTGGRLNQKGRGERPRLRSGEPGPGPFPGIR